MNQHVKFDSMDFFNLLKMMNGSNHALGSHKINDFEKNGLPLKNAFNTVLQCRTPRVIYFFSKYFTIYNELRLETLPSPRVWPFKKDE